MEQPSSNKKYYKEIDIAKGITIILVILGHALPNLNGEVPKGFPDILMQVIYSFHMPVFFFLSGLLAFKILNFKKIEWKYLGGKTKRLMIPYFFCGVLYLAMKFAVAKLVGISDKSSPIWKTFFGINPNYELWFLYVLFICFVIAILFVRKKNIIPVIIVGAIISVCFGFLTEDGFALLNTLSKICKNAVFFMTGMYIGLNYERIKQKINIKIVLPSLLIFVVANIIIINTEIILLSNAAKLFSSFAGIIIVMWLSIKLSKTPVSRPGIGLGKDSMCIYIMSGFILPVLQQVLLGKMNISYSLSVIISVPVTIIVSLLISYVIKKIKYLRLLMFGMD